MPDGGEKAKPCRPRINSPDALDPSDPAYLRQCGFALEPSLIGLIEMAVEAGWSRENVVVAMLIEMERHLGMLGIRIEYDELQGIRDRMQADRERFH